MDAVSGRTCRRFDGRGDQHGFSLWPSGHGNPRLDRGFHRPQCDFPPLPPAVGQHSAQMARAQMELIGPRTGGDLRHDGRGFGDSFHRSHGTIGPLFGRSLLLRHARKQLGRTTPSLYPAVAGTARPDGGQVLLRRVASRGSYPLGSLVSTPVGVGFFFGRALFDDDRPICSAPRTMGPQRALDLSSRPVAAVHDPRGRQTFGGQSLSEGTTDVVGICHSLRPLGNQCPAQVLSLHFPHRVVNPIDHLPRYAGRLVQLVVYRPWPDVLPESGDLL